MHSDEREISCYSTQQLLNYAKKKNISSITEGIDIPFEILNNPQEWTYAHIWTRMAQNIEIALGGKEGVLIDVLREIWLKETNILYPLMLRIAPIGLIIKSLTSSTNKYSSKNMLLELKPIGKNKYSFTVRRTKPGHFSRQMCDFNKGAALAVFTSKGYKNVTINEHTCIARDGAPECRYTLSMTPPRSFAAKIFSGLKVLFRDRNTIIQHLEDNHAKLQQQYQEILSMRDFYSHIMDSMGEAIIWMKPDGTVNFINHAFCHLVGYKEEMILLKPFKTFFNNASSTLTFEKLCSKCQQHPHTPFETEIQYQPHEGIARSGQTTIKWVSNEHRSSGFLISIRDITETRRIERQLSAAENRYRSLYENSPAIIIAINMQGFFLYANPVMTEQSGYSEEELKTMHFKQLIAPQANYNVDYLIENLLNNPTKLQEVHFKTKNGEWKCIALNTYHIYETDGNTLAGIAGIGIDLTETKHLNEQLIKSQRMELLGQLASGMAHDFGNILTSISGFSKLIAGKSEDEKIVHYAESIGRSGKRAHNLIKNLLAFSRDDNRQSEVFDLVVIAEEVKDMLYGAVPKMINIKGVWPAEPCYISGDPGKIHQCILNLCINARDAIGMTPGQIIIKVLKNDDLIQVKVEDTGSGIPPNIIEKIFDPFFSTKPKKSGTGLGLSVVYGIIKSHGGDINVLSHPGEGTTFTITFPPSDGKPDA